VLALVLNRSVDLYLISHRSSWSQRKKTGSFQTITCLLSGHQGQVSKIIDVEVIAKSSAINVEQVIAGLHAIASVLLQLYSNKNKNPVLETSSFSVLKQAS